MLLARDVGLAGFPLRIERIELLLEALLRRFAGVDGAAVGQAPVYCQMPYGIEADRRVLLNALDNEAQLLGDEEDRRIEEVVTNDSALAAAAEQIDEDEGSSIVDEDDEDDSAS